MGTTPTTPPTPGHPTAADVRADLDAARRDGDPVRAAVLAEQLADVHRFPRARRTVTR